MQDPGLSDFDLSSPLPSGQRTVWPPAARRAVAVGAGCGCLVLLQAFLFWGMIALYLHLRPPDGLVVQVQAPPGVRVGQKFPLTLVVKNEGDQPFTVNSVVARDPLLRRLDLSNPQPPPNGPGVTGKRSSSQGGETRVFGSAIWQYAQAVPPGQTWQVRFDATPRQPGPLAAVVEVQVGLFPKTARASIDVAPASDVKPAAP